MSYKLKVEGMPVWTILKEEEHDGILTIFKNQQNHRQVKVISASEIPNIFRQVLFLFNTRQSIPQTTFDELSNLLNVALRNSKKICCINTDTILSNADASRFNADEMIADRLPGLEIVPSRPQHLRAVT